jgi:hypothetical protein
MKYHISKNGSAGKGWLLSAAKVRYMFHLHTNTLPQVWVKHSNIINLRIKGAWVVSFMTWWTLPPIKNFQYPMGRRVLMCVSQLVWTVIRS